MSHWWCSGAFDASVCNLIIAGDVPFANNSAQNGGAVFLYEGVAHVSGGSFTGNVAVESGGAMSISRPTDVQVHGVSFVSNNAAIGGGVALTSSGDNPTKFRDCTFESNTAVDGGALYVSTTDLTEVVYNCSFNGNHAGEMQKAEQQEQTTSSVQIERLSKHRLKRVGGSVCQPHPLAAR